VPLLSVALDDLVIEDERSFRHIALYDRLKQALRRCGYRVRVPAAGTRASWDRVLFLNLTFWSGDGGAPGRSGAVAPGADVLSDRSVPADVIAHMAWHHLVSRHLAGPNAGEPGDGRAAPPTAAALLFGESIASAFDLYLVGRMLPSAPDSDFITSQVPILSECAQEAGLSDARFAALLDDVTREPERAFEDMRTLLLDATTALLRCRDADQAQLTLEGFAGHRFEPLLHHYQLSNWILYARAYAPGAASAATGDRDDQSARVARLDATLRQSADPLAWLADHLIDDAGAEVEIT
jgi:hypothetical protein